MLFHRDATTWSSINRNLMRTTMTFHKNVRQPRVPSARPNKRAKRFSVARVISQIFAHRSQGGACNTGELTFLRPPARRAFPICSTQTQHSTVSEGASFSKWTKLAAHSSGVASWRVYEARRRKKNGEEIGELRNCNCLMANSKIPRRD